MLKSKDIIVFSDDWGRHPFSCQHIMKHLLTDNRVIWVNTIGMRRIKLQVYDIRRGLQKIWSWAKTKQPEIHKEAPMSLSPVMIPFSTLPMVRDFNRASVVKTVKEVCDRLNFRKPLFLTTLPNAGDYVGAFNEEASIYYCVDDFIRWPGVYEQVVREQEARLLNEIDLLVCSSDELAKIKPTNAAVRVLRHGVDFQHFSSVSATIPDEFLLKDITQPIVGYFGLFGEWIDLDLIENTVKKFPHISFVFIGNVVVNIDRFKKYANIHFIGAVPYSELPLYIHFFDVLLLPYITKDRGQTITPLKLREYLATGKPVVTTSIPECKLFESFLHVAESSESFIELLGNALKSPKVLSVEQQLSVAPEDWLLKAEEFSTMIGDILGQK